MLIERIEVAGKIFASVYISGLSDAAADRIRKNPEILELVRESDLMLSTSGLRITYRDRTLAYSLDTTKGCIEFHRCQRLLAEKATMIALEESLDEAVTDFTKKTVRHSSDFKEVYTKPDENKQ